MDAENKKGFWAIVAVVCVMAVFFAPNYAQFQLSPLAHVIVPTYKIDATQFSALFSAAMIPGILLSLVAGLLTDRFGAKRTIAVASSITAFALIARIFAPDFSTLFICMVLAGVVATFINANLAKIMGMWFTPERVGIAVGVGFASGNLAQAIGMGTGALFPSVHSLFVFTAIIGVVALAIWILLFREQVPNSVKVSVGFEKRNRSSAPSGESSVVLQEESQPALLDCLRKVVKSRNIWVLGLALGCCMTGVMSLATFMPQALQTARGFSPEEAGTIASALTFGNLFGALSVPLINAKVRKMKPVVCILSLVGGLATVFAWQMPDSLAIMIVLFLAGFAFGGVIVSLISVPVLLPEIGPVYAGTAGGIACTLQLAGAVVVPTYILTPLFGNQYALFYAAAGAFCVLIFLFTLLLPEVLQKNA